MGSIADAVVVWGRSFFPRRSIAEITLTPNNGFRAPHVSKTPQPNDRNVIKRLVAIGILAALSSAAALSFAAVPTPDQVKAAYQSSEAELLDRHGESIQTLRIDMDVRRLPWVELKQVSPALTSAVLQAEDQRFEQHRGADLEAFGKAAWDNLFRRRARGASTITMQLAALLDPQLRAPRGGRSWSRKWDQITTAQEFEASWSKPQILEAYLNLVSFRGELQGIGAAAQNLFRKTPAGLNHAESAILASLIRAPNAASKTVAKRACKLAQENKLNTSCAKITTAVTNALERAPIRAAQTPAAQVAQRLLKKAAQRVPSTLDAGLQRFAFDSLKRQLHALGDRNINDGAIVVLDNRTGQILAYVANDGDSEVDGAAAPRQAGSTLKPFLYQLAIERKFLTAASILDDTPIDIATPSGLYIPQNYDKEFKGYASVRTSLASSLNVPAVRTLLMTGIERFVNRLQDLGLTSLTESADYYGYSLALGSAEVSLLELTNAYRTLANGGLASPVAFVPGAVPQQRRVLDPRAAFVINDILSDRAARSLTFGLKNELATSFWSAVKTGTSKDMRDNWCLGFSRKFTVGVWVGNFDGAPMWDVSGVSGAAPVWRDVMDFLQKDNRSDAPAAPSGVIAQNIEYQPELEAARSEWFIAGTESARIEVLADAKRVPKIRYPADGSIIAFDPDIPEANQRLLFQARVGQGLLWRLDGVALAPAADDFPWRPASGSHELSLIDRDGKVVDSVKFQVRGAASS